MKIALVRMGTFFELKVIDSFPKFMCPPQTHEKGGRIYDRKQVYPKIAQAERCIRRPF
jgi:hypothetical protein